MKKRTLSLLLAAILVVGLLPVTALAESPMEKVALVENGSASATSVIVYGSHEWYVIEHDEAANRLYLFCTDKIVGEKYGLSTSTNGHAYSGMNYNSTASTDYTGSLMQEKLAAMLGMDFSSIEQSAIMKRTLDGTTDATAPQNQALWPLSKAEADGLNTGLRTALSPDHWWLRSERNGYIWFADAGGNYYADWTHANQANYGVRPGFYLDTSTIAFVSNAVNGKLSTDSALTSYSSLTSNKYKLTLLDSSRSSFSIATAAITPTSITVGYSGAKTGTNEYLSAVIMNGSDDVLYYGRIAHLSSAADASGSVTISIPSGMALGQNAVLKLFNEQYNGDNNTDYASDLQAVSLTKTAYTITNSLTNIESSNKTTYCLMSDTTNDYTATLSVEPDHILPTTISVKVGGNTLTAGTDYTYIGGTLTIPAASITGDIEIIAADFVPEAPVISVTELPGGTVNTAYSQTLAATGDTPITWEVESGNLPDGLFLDANTGVISGTPTTAGTFSFTVKAHNGVQPDALEALSITIGAPADPNIPVMGDNRNTLLWIALLFLSGGALTALEVINSRRSKQS